MRYIFLLVSLASCNPFNYYPDSPIEERVEEVIREKSGIEIDLSGYTPDPDTKVRF